MAKIRKTAKPLTFRGANCKSTCAGHRKGYNYARRGGRDFSSHSKSFNRGMRLFLGMSVPKSRSRTKR